MISSPFLGGIGSYLIHLAFGTSTSTSLGIFSLLMLLGLISTMSGIQAYQNELESKQRKKRKEGFRQKMNGYVTFNTDEEDGDEQQENGNNEGNESDVNFDSPNSHVNLRQRSEIIPEPSEIVD